METNRDLLPKEEPVPNFDSQVTLRKESQGTQATELNLDFIPGSKSALRGLKGRKKYQKVEKEL